MRIYIILASVLCFLVGFVSSCESEHNQQIRVIGKLQSAQSSKGNKKLSFSNDSKGLEDLLVNNKIDEFYARIAPENFASLQNYLEDQAKNGALYNYGVLLNAGLINAKNKKIFKPRLKKIKEFSHVPNEGLCFLNAALYNIANSKFFDDFLEIDGKHPSLWRMRDPKNRVIADKILRTLREVIYEIRLGERTAADKIALMRGRHVDAFAEMNDIVRVANIYKELLFSYSFDPIKHYWIDFEAGGIYKNKIVNVDFTPINIAIEPSINFYKDLKTSGSLPNFSYGVIGKFFEQLAAKGGSQDIFYLDTIFAIIDPWGKIARYMTAATFDADTYSPWFSSLFLIDDSYYVHDFSIVETGLAFGVKNNRRIVRLIHNAHNLNNLPADGSAFRFFRDDQNNIIGKITSKLSLDKNFKLVAKSRHNHNHLISELYRDFRREWETHKFFGPPQFSNAISVVDDGSYKDYLYYFKLK